VRPIAASTTTMHVGPMAYAMPQPVTPGPRGRQDGLRATPRAERTAGRAAGVANKLVRLPPWLRHALSAFGPDRNVWRVRAGAATNPETGTLPRIRYFSATRTAHDGHYTARATTKPKNPKTTRRATTNDDGRRRRTTTLFRKAPFVSSAFHQ
jgi:hypothetical protein